MPENGRLSASPLVTEPVPDTEKPQDGNPGPLAEPLTVKGTLMPLSCPDADPETVKLPAHKAEKVPETEFAL